MSINTSNVRPIETTLDALDSKLDLHIDQFEDYKELERKNWNYLMESQQANTDAIAQLTTATAGLVETWQTAHSIQRFIKWASAFMIFSGISTVAVSIFNRLT